MFLTDNNIIVDGATTTGWNTNQNQMKNICPFYSVFQVLKVVFMKNFKMQPPDLLFLVINRTSFNIIRKKRFSTQIFNILTDSLILPQPH